MPANEIARDIIRCSVIAQELFNRAIFDHVVARIQVRPDHAKRRKTEDERFLTVRQRAVSVDAAHPCQPIVAACDVGPGNFHVFFTADGDGSRVVRRSRVGRHHDLCQGRDLVVNRDFSCASGATGKRCRCFAAISDRLKRVVDDDDAKRSGHGKIGRVRDVDDRLRERYVIGSGGNRRARNPKNRGVRRDTRAGYAPAQM